MFQRILQYELIDFGGRAYRPRAYGEALPDSEWNGWLVFFPFDGSEAIAPPHPETTQPTFSALEVWASGLTTAYREGALARALAVAEQAAALARLAAGEYEAVDDAERLEAAADVERTSAAIEADAARLARAEAQRIRRERIAMGAGTPAVASDRPRRGGQRKPASGAHGTQRRRR